MSTDFLGDSQYPTSDSSTSDAAHVQAVDALDAQKRDRFELLSAYLDGEVTVAERQQVESWLATDPKAQGLHTRLLNLRYGLQSIPVPATNQPLEQTVEQIFVRVDRRPKLALIWGGVGAAVAAGLIGALTSLLPNEQPFVPQMAERTAPGTAQITGAPIDIVGPDSLMVALDRPPIEIPKKGVSAPAQGSEDFWLYPSNQDIR